MWGKGLLCGRHSESLTNIIINKLCSRATCFCKHIALLHSLAIGPPKGCFNYCYLFATQSDTVRYRHHGKLNLYYTDRVIALYLICTCIYLIGITHTHTPDCGADAWEIVRVLMTSVRSATCGPCSVKLVRGGWVGCWAGRGGSFSSSNSVIYQLLEQCTVSSQYGP